MSKKYFTIGEVAKHFSVAPSLIRFWEKEFNAVLQPAKNRAGARRYQEKDIAQLRYIYSLVKEKGYSLAGARNVLQQHRSEYKLCPAEVIDRLQAVRAFLMTLKSQLQ